MRLRLVFGIVALALLLGCESPTPIPELPPNEILQRAARAMLAQNTMHFRIDIEGAPAPINTALGLGLRAAEGNFVRPDRIGVNLRVVTPLASIQADMIALGDEQYLTNFLTQKWEVLPAQFGFNPAVMFHPEFGLEKTLEQGLDGAANLGIESLDGAQTYHVRGSVDGQRLQVMSGGMLSTQRIEADVWVETGSFRVLKAVLLDPGFNEGDASTWTLTFSSFGDAFTIEAPEVE
jgi:hypothetical protein